MFDYYGGNCQGDSLNYLAKGCDYYYNKR